METLGLDPSSGGAVEETPGRRTRATILSRAVEISSVEGLEGLTIGRLASDVVMSKAGLIAHFDSKAGLQVATLDAAARIFIRTIIEPAQTAERGLPRLRALVEGWISYMENRTFPGGCFFAAAGAEFDGRPGRVRDRLVELINVFLALVEAETVEAQERRQLDPNLDPRQIIFELHALVLEANWADQLLSDTSAFERARTAVDERLTRAWRRSNRGRSIGQRRVAATTDESRERPA